MYEYMGKMFICRNIWSSLVCLLVCVTLAIIPVDGQWSGFVNNLRADVDYLCPEDQAIIGVASDHDRGANDRQWEFLCGSGGEVAGILTTCNLEATINLPTEEITYDCPESAYIGGFQSAFDASTNDRIWRPYCCTRPQTALINCVQSTTWENRVGEILNWTTPGLTVITGVETFFDFVVNDRRWRYHYCNIQVDCGDPGLPENSDRQGSRFLYTDMLHYTCNGGYYQSSGDSNLTCLNTGQWDGALPVCTACTDIANCEQISCTNATDHMCSRCQSDNGTGYGESAYRNLMGVECEPLCSWLAYYCYPGSCMDGVSSCNCSRGFTGNDCLEITEDPTVTSCRSTISSSGQSASVLCFNHSNLVFVNFVPTQINVTWEALYLDPNPVPRRPAYVRGFDIGLVGLYTEASLYRAANPNVVISTSSYNCTNIAVSSDAPHNGPLTCSAVAMNLSQHSFLHGDYLMLDAYSWNGGFLDIFDLDTNTATRHYYNGIFVVHSSQYQLDLVPPSHCLFVPSSDHCTQPILDVGDGLTASNMTTVLWGGWIDSPAAVDAYSLDVYLLEEAGAELKERISPKIHSSTHQDTRVENYTINIVLPSDGPYSFVLQVMDEAGNLQYARRLLLFDATSRLTVNSNIPLIITSAIPQTGYIWQNSSVPIVTVAGKGHFYNTNLQTSNWLAAVANFSGATIAPAYDQPLLDGQYPRMGTTNALGVLSLLYEIVIDREGGMSNDSLIIPMNFSTAVDDITLESVGFNITATDGDTARIWFKATDFKSQEIYDSVVVHFDSSPPVLRDVWLEYNGQAGLLLHGSHDLTIMIISFEAWDEHSGLWSLEWSIGTWYGGDDVGSGRVPLLNYTKESCIPDQCMCNSIGGCYALRHRTSPLPTDLLSLTASHDTDYYITIVVTNLAYLQTQLTQQITIDTTPPLQGVVFDGNSSSDIDYQQEPLVTAWWSGFFDRESDIQFYQYIFGTACADQSIFTIPALHNISTTNDTRATWTAPADGLYHVTVAAVNTALRHSTAVCSDGIVIDNSQPIISRELLIADRQYYHDREINYIVAEYSFNISWSASDNFGIYDYFVGIASSQSLTSAPDLIPFCSTVRQPFAPLHSNSLTTGRQFYVIIRVEDHALLSDMAVFGPIMLDTSPPVVNGSASVKSDRNIITVFWHVDMIIDDEQVEPISAYEYAVGRSPYGTEIHEFMPVNLTTDCPNNHFCFTLNASSFQLLDGHTYYFPLRVTNLAGLSVMTLSEEYVHISAPPSLGFVYDIDLSRQFDVSTGRNLHMEDIDIAITVDSISVRWDCCVDGVIYAIGLGFAPGHDDVINFTVTTAQGVHSFTNVSLVNDRTYYTTVIATNKFGPAIVSSDGVLVLQTAEQDIQRYALVLDGHDVESGDVTSQASHSHAVARWHFPGNVMPYISHYRWALLAAGSQEVIKDYENVGDTRQASAAGLVLVTNQLYIAAVQACHLSDCFTPVHSSGFYVATAPVAKSVTATYDPMLSVIQGSWEGFGEIRYYEWSISEELGGLLLPWQRVSGDVTIVTYILKDSISYSPAQRIVFTVRGVNEAGLHTSVSIPVRWIISGEEVVQDMVMFDPPVVYDVQEIDITSSEGISDWSELEHYAVNLRDIDYVNSNSILHASWPVLRYQVYSWSVSKNNSYQDCNSPYTIACGSTVGNFITVEQLNLTHGHTYYVCVQASINIIPTPLPSILTACSDGVIVDLAPPTAGCVQIVVADYTEGLEFGSAVGGDGSMLDAVACESIGGFQSSNSELVLRWDNFTGVDTTYHVTSITHYEYAIGSVPGGSDVVDFTDVGIINQLVLSNLQLLSGLQYYATVKAYNFVGLMTQATSMAVTVDTSPPIISGVLIGKQLDYSVTSRYNIVISWYPILDPESGLASMEWAIGSQPGWSDIMVWQQVVNEGHNITIEVLDGVVDGQLIFASILAVNRAGLTQVKTSIGYIVDTSPPTAGVVLDGADTEDVDYCTDATSYTAQWVGFGDPHSDIIEYEWAIGSCYGCTDIQTFVSVGLMTEATRGGLSLKDGWTYYVTVRVCNLAGLCITETSNGATIDRSPPIPGTVLDGLVGANLQFQASVNYVTAHWSGFHDVHSAIAYYQFYSGSQPNASNIVSPFVVDASQTAVAISLPTPLIHNSTVYSTVVAYNGAGLTAVVTTDGMKIITEAPAFISSPFIDVFWAGALLSNTQYDNSVIRLVSNISDHSYTVTHYSWAVYSTRQVALPVPPLISHVSDGIVLTGLSLSDGDEYYAEVDACNSAGLCSKGNTMKYFIDSSPPIDGYFAVQTSSVEQVFGRVETMTWRNSPILENSRIRLYFAGFSDPHSGIEHYYCSVGTSYSTSHLTGGFKLLEPQQVNTQGTHLADVTLTRQLNLDEVLYISLWAENGVGLNSRVVQASFSLTSISSLDGTLDLLRTSTCSIDSCLGHCTCAARGDLCVPPASTSCNLINTEDLPHDMHINVTDTVPQMLRPITNGRLYTASSDKLAVQWQAFTPNVVQWFEWSVGISGSSPGTGLLDTTNEQIWFNAGTNLSAVFSASPLYPLTTGLTYVFHVRAWYNDTAYAVFVSPGVTVDTTGPQIVEGFRTSEVMAGIADIDHVSSPSTINVTWQGVFEQLVSSYDIQYEIAIGDVPAGYDIIGYSMLSTVTHMTLSDLQLLHGRLYYSTIVASSPTGLRAVSISDGFAVDVSPPISGTVLDNYLYIDRVAQSNNNTYVVRWYGFVDQETSIDYYELAIGDDLNDPPTSTQYINVELNLKHSISGLTLTAGLKYHAYVTAVNQIGMRSSSPAISDGLIIDDSRPTVVNCTHRSVNLLSNPSFDGPNSSNVHEHVISNEMALSNWQHSLVEAKVLSINELVAVNGRFSLFMAGSISQTVTTSPNTEYRVTFYVHRWRNDGDLVSGTITAPGLERRFEILQYVTTWTRVSYVFKASSLSSTITISTSGSHHAFAIDGVVVDYCISSIAISEMTGWSEAINIGTSRYLSAASIRLYVDWHITDNESGIAEYLWAIGTSQGGEQLMKYTSTGTQPWDVSPVLHLQHNTSVFVSVLAWNHAGLETQVQSKEYIVDLTPPLLAGSLRSIQRELELHYQPAAAALSVDWSDMVDYESNISYCLWAIGSSVGKDDLQPFTMVNGTTRSAVNNVVMPTGLVFATVTCINQALLYTTVTSDGILVFSRPPNHTNAKLTILSLANSIYPVMDNFVPTTSLTLSWSGFEDLNSSYLNYEYRITESSGATEGWISVGATLQLLLSNLSIVHDQTHTIEVRATNPGGLTSQPIIENFTISSEVPVDTGTSINVTIVPPNLLIDWSGKFMSPVHLYYEVSVGTRMGSASILRWLETTGTSIQSTNPQLSLETDYFVTVTAVTYAGIHTTDTLLVPAMPIA